MTSVKIELDILPGTYSWAMTDNVPKEFKIQEALIKIDHEHRVTVRYTMRTTCSPLVCMSTDTIYRTKQDLLNSL